MKKAQAGSGGGPTVGTQHNTTHNNNTSMITVCRRVNSQRGARPGSLGVFLSSESGDYITLHYDFAEVAR